MPEALPTQPSPLRSLEQLRWWERFHVRLTFFNGLVLLGLLTAVGSVFYFVVYDSEFRGLQRRISATVGLLARNIDPEVYREIIVAPDGEDPRHKALEALFQSVVDTDPAATGVYLMTARDFTASMSDLITVVDTAVYAEPDPPGTPYDASSLPMMQRGFLEVAVEDRMYADEWGYSVSGYAPVKNPDGSPLALVGLDVDASHIRAIRWRVLTVVGVIVGVAVSVLALFAFFLGRRIKHPLQEMSHAADAISVGDFDLEGRPTRRDEFGLMTNHLHQIAKNLKERDLLRDTFGRYVSPDIARRLMQDRSAGTLGGEEREVTVVFSDIEGYSTMTENIGPQEVVGLLNTYLGEMNAIIDRHEGCIIEILGDAILAVFNAPNDLPGHEEAAVRCALEMQGALDQLNETWATQPIARIWRQAGKDRLRARIGVHSGTVVAGNIGSRTRMKYGLIGDVVNVAARIEGLNKVLGTGLLISDTTYGALPAALRAHAQRRGEHQVKGRQEAVAVYSFQMPTGEERT